MTLHYQCKVLSDSTATDGVTNLSFKCDTSSSHLLLDIRPDRNMCLTARVDKRGWDARGRGGNELNEINTERLHVCLPHVRG